VRRSILSSPCLFSFPSGLEESPCKGFTLGTSPSTQETLETLDMVVNNFHADDKEYMDGGPHGRINKSYVELILDLGFNGKNRVVNQYDSNFPQESITMVSPSCAHIQFPQGMTYIP